MRIGERERCPARVARERRGGAVQVRVQRAHRRPAGPVLVHQHQDAVRGGNHAEARVGVEPEQRHDVGTGSAQSHQGHDDRQRPEHEDRLHEHPGQGGERVAQVADPRQRVLAAGELVEEEALAAEDLDLLHGAEGGLRPFQHVALQRVRALAPATGAGPRHAEQDCPRGAEREHERERHGGRGEGEDRS